MTSGEKIVDLNPFHPSQSTIQPSLTDPPTLLSYDPSGKKKPPLEQTETLAMLLKKYHPTTIPI